MNGKHELSAASALGGVAKADAVAAAVAGESAVTGEAVAVLAAAESIGCQCTLAVPVPHRTKFNATSSGSAAAPGTGTT